VPTHAVHSVSKSCQTHACLQSPSIAIRSIHASALCMQSPPAGDSRTAKRHAAQLVSSCYCRSDPKAAAVICSVTRSRRAILQCWHISRKHRQPGSVASSSCAGWKCCLAMLAHQQEAPTARKCGQQQLCRLEMLSCNVGMSAGRTKSQEPI